LSLLVYEKVCIKRALEATKGHVLETAQALGIGKSTLYRKMKRHRIPLSYGLGRR